ncbi:transglutaminase-like domain-containing protein [Streptomyces sp. NBC_00249]|uniref:transglutaminase-like domain-containing protein n=1 Tax=Streptomyces sp. NBC_00249 TaxID=2975690 RepID=UPI0022514DE2|nr:transglutaminase-like domain-containing protein [Streptomyces sp. NBC_00249]MCX5192402.1 transglutaminase-like domain-containing protein [Streptomyces sp. NBC_00249]
MSGTFARAAGRALPAGAAAGIAGSAFHRAFGYEALALPLAVAALLPVALVVVAAGGRGRLPVEVSLPLSAGLCLLAGSVVLYGSGPSEGVLSSLRAMPGTAAQGWAAFLDVPLPAAADPVLLAVPFTAVWTASAAGAELAVRARRVTAATVPGFALLVVATALCLPGRGALLGQVVALGAVAAATLPRAVLAPRTVWLVLGPVAVTTVAAVVLSALWPGGKPVYDPREHRPTVEEAAAVTSPLAQYTQWEQQPEEALFTVERGPSAPPSSAGPERWRLASLTAYDGRRWTLHDVFTPVFGPLPVDPALGVRAAGRLEGGGRSSAVIRNLRGRLLPVPDSPAAIRSDGTRLLFNRFERTALAVPGLAPDARYGITAGVAPAVTPADAAGLSPASGVPQALDVPGSVPPSLRELADRVRGAASTPYGRAQALASELSREYRRVAKAPLNQPVASLGRFLADRKGSAVDFAAAYALAARLEGLPCRIVVGFRVPAGTGPHTVLARDAALWTEVAFEGVGWLPFEPVPAASSAAEDEVRPEPDPVVPQPSPSPSPSASSSSSPGPAAGASPAAPTPAGGGRALGPASGIPWSTWAAAALTALVSGAAGARIWMVLVRPVLRRRAGRRLGTPALRVLAAWHDARHAFDAAGAAPPDPSRTLVESARMLSGAEPVAAVRASAVSLAQLATRARFCEPTAGEVRADPSLSGMSPQDAELAWLLAESIREELRPGRRLWVVASVARVLLPTALSARVLPARALRARPRTEEERVEHR